MRIPQRIAAAIAIAFTAAGLAFAAGAATLPSSGDSVVLAGNVSNCP
ncbi:hypothetical protein [Streptomyces sp. NPDC002825]